MAHEPSAPGGAPIPHPEPLPPPIPASPLPVAAVPVADAPDGVDRHFIRYVREPGDAPPEFLPQTRVIYVNGINTALDGSRAEAQAYAKLTRHDVELVHVSTAGVPHDLGASAIETWAPNNASTWGGERAIANEVVSLAAAGKDVHIAAYSRGALVTERGLELAKYELEQRGFSADYVRDKVFSHVTVETINGASHNMPDGVRAVNYVCEGDVLVGQSLGMGPIAPIVRMGLDGAITTSTITGAGLDALVRDGIGNTPSGPIIITPPAPSLNPLDQHLATNVFPHMKPFEEAYAPYAAALKARMAEHPTPMAGTPPPPTQPAQHPADPKRETKQQLEAHPAPQPGSSPSTNPNRPPDALDRVADDPNRLQILRTNASGAQTMQAAREPFSQSGRILSVDHDRVIQSVRGGETFTYRTADLLRLAPDPAAAYKQLEVAATRDTPATIGINQQALNVQTRGPEPQHERGR